MPDNVSFRGAWKSGVSGDGLSRAARAQEQFLMGFHLGLFRSDLAVEPTFETGFHFPGERSVNITAAQGPGDDPACPAGVSSPMDAMKSFVGGRGAGVPVPGAGPEVATHHFPTVFLRCWFHFLRPEAGDLSNIPQGTPVIFFARIMPERCNYLIRLFVNMFRGERSDTSW